MPRIRRASAPRDVHVLVAPQLPGQHFWHLVMGEVLPCVAVLAASPPGTRLYVYKRDANAPLNTVYDELGVVVRSVVDAPPSALGPLARWDHRMATADKTRLAAAVQYLCEWADGAPPTPPSPSAAAAAAAAAAPAPEPGAAQMVVQLRKNTPVLDRYYEQLHNARVHLGTVYNPSGVTRINYGIVRRSVPNLEAVGLALRRHYGADVVTVTGDDGDTFRAQIRRYRKANCLVLGHGAGMVHALWMQPRSVIVEIIPRAKTTVHDGAADGLRRICAFRHFRFRRLVVPRAHSPIEEARVFAALHALGYPASPSRSRTHSIRQHATKKSVSERKRRRRVRHDKTTSRRT